MKDRFQLVLVDSRGHGQSDRPTDPAAYALPKRVEDLTAILDHAGIDRAHFYGYSMGGWIGYGVLKFAPDRFLSAVIGGFGPVTDPYFGNDPADLARGAVERRETARPDEFEVLHAVLRAAAAFEGAEDAVRTASMPLLFFAGTEDPRYESVKAAATLNDNASFLELAGLNHPEAGKATDQYVPQLIDFFDHVAIEATSA
jgi:pimeloyl-ACP methyl ester carboxylesterase